MHKPYYYDNLRCLPLHVLSFQNAGCLSISQFVNISQLAIYFAVSRMAEVDGIEPSITESKSVALPFGYTSLMRN